MNTTLTPNPIITDCEDGGYRIETYWTGVSVDRPQSFSIVLPTRDAAVRYCNAVEDGKVFDDPEIRIDGDGNTYVTCRRINVIGRRWNSCLVALGY